MSEAATGSESGQHDDNANGQGREKDRKKGNDKDNRARAAFDALVSNLQHWQLELDQDGILRLDCDVADSSTNVLSQAVLEEFAHIVTYLEVNLPKGVVLGSAKPASFILGADIREFDAFTEAADVTARIQQGHAILSRFERLVCHKVASIHGFCLGGGLELALCCDYLIAMNLPETRLGFPEVKLGIFPGLGGSVRATEKVGGYKGMELMLTGRMLKAPAARAMGLVDELVDEFGSLRWASRKAILQKRRKTLGWLAAMSNRQPARMVLAGVMHRKTAGKARPDHYPAPFSLIDLWEAHRDNRHRMFEEEAKRVGELMVSDTARNLRRVFFMSERMKGLGKAADFPVRRVHVVGAGVMGGDIAAWCVLQGMEVTLQDREMKYIEPALKRAGKLFAKRLKKPPAIAAAQTRLMADVAGDGVPRADVIIEAIFEDADAKRALYADIEPRMAAHAILATNTSALPLEELARDLAHPARFIGLHFFNPVAKMPLVEVVYTADTEEQWVTRGCAFASAINRFPLPVRSSPGFLVNRVLAPYLMEAFTMMAEGIDKDIIDAAAIRFGMPMGPIELADTVGLDVCLKVAETLGDSEADVDAERAMLEKKIAAGRLGRKTGKGFYGWDGGKPDRKAVDVDCPYGDRLAGRLMQPFLAEVQAVSDEGIVADDDLLDAGIIFGTGFAPFRGGPMHYLNESMSS